MKSLQIFLLGALCLLSTNSIFAQFNGEGEGFLNPVEWTFEPSKKVGDRYELQFKATIEEGWHLYSHFIADDGPVPTSFTFEDNEAIEIKDKLKENGDKITKHDDAFDMELSWYEHEVTFSQKVKLKNGFEGTIVKGELEFMVCDDEKCLPPDYIPFAFAIGNAEIQTAENITIEDNATTSIGGIGLPVEEEKASTWSYRVKDDGEHLKVEWKVKLGKDWQIYSQHIDEGGPIATAFIYDERGNLEIIGEVNEDGELIKKKEPIFDDMELLSYKNEVTFSQLLKWSDERDPILSGAIEYMTCDNEACIFDGVDFKIDLSKRNQWQQIAGIGELPPDVEGLPDIMQESEFIKDGLTNNCKGHGEKKKSYWIIFLLGFGGGLIALLTPCVFPMIPLTVSFFTKGSEKASAKGITNAIIYGVSIIVIYIVMTMCVIFLLGPDKLNWIATDPIFNIVFFLIFVFFAFSFFGYYELELPSSWANKTDKLSSKGGLIGIFFMAFTLALVSFSCTGPIIGSLILGVVQGGFLGPFFGMLGFSIALALPFTLFAIFPKWLNSLPKSGGWLNSVKVFLGFLELAFALKFFSTADLTKHMGILKYELFIGLWILIFLLLTLYMFGFIKFPHDSKGSKPGIGKLFIGLASLLFTAYLTFGLVNYKPLLSGIAPGPGYSFFKQAECPPGVNICFHDYDEGMAYAKKSNQPVMLDFTGHGCVNCRLMENNVWSKDKVNPILNKYVIISLYVDDRNVLPEDLHYVSDASGKSRKIDKVGKYWVDFQIRHFNRLSQPFYVLVSPDKQVLNQPVGYTPDADKYIEFLQCGLDNLNKVCPECIKK